VPDLNSVQFDLADSTLREESAEHRGWSNAAGVYHVLRVTPRRANWAFDLRDEAAAIAFYSNQCIERGGVMLSMNVVQVGKHEALQGIFKYRAPIPGSLAMMFVGILWIPYQDWIAQINVESLESGTTGMREATVMAIEGDNWPRPETETEPVAVSSPEEMFSLMAAQALRVLLSDAEKYDAVFPDHPLSKVRERMVQVKDSLKIVASARELAPFRLAPLRQEPSWKRWLGL
jgi:hypothetical protein